MIILTTNHENHEIRRELMISYVKLMNEFRTFFHVRHLFLEISPMKFRRVTKDMVKFVCDATFKLSFAIKSCFYKQ
jgi:hypothetical protein